MLLPALPSASGPFVGPGDRYPNRQLKTKSVPVWLLADSQPHSLHSLKRFFWRRSIVINHFGSKGASPALPSAPPCTEARRGPILARKRWASGIPASTLSSSGAGPNPCSPTTKPEFPPFLTAGTHRAGPKCLHWTLSFSEGDHSSVGRQFFRHSSELHSAASRFRTRERPFYPLGSGSAQILCSMSPNSLRFRCPSANNNQ